MNDVCVPSPCCKARHVIFAFPPSSPWAGGKPVPGTTEPFCSLPCPLAFPANRACLPCKANLCNTALEMRMVMLCLQ